jgi:hypothetical protein
MSLMQLAQRLDESADRPEFWRPEKRARSIFAIPFWYMPRNCIMGPSRVSWLNLRLEWPSHFSLSAAMATIHRRNKRYAARLV